MHEVKRICFFLIMKHIYVNVLLPIFKKKSLDTTLAEVVRNCIKKKKKIKYLQQRLTTTEKGLKYSIIWELLYLSKITNILLLSY